MHGQVFDAEKGLGRSDLKLALVEKDPGAVVDFGTGCPGSGGTIPVLRASDVVRAGSVLSVAVQTSLPPGGGGAVTILLFDTNRQNVNLGFLGAPGCTAFALPSIGSVLTLVNQNSRASFKFCVPRSGTGATLVMQALNFPVPGVPGQLSASNGTEIVIQP